jgi:hypothetical protein
VDRVVTFYFKDLDIPVCLHLTLFHICFPCFLIHRICSIRACSRTWRGSSVALFCWPASVIRSVHDVGLANIFSWLWSRK